MIKLAFTHPRYRAQLDANPRELSGVEVVYKGGSLIDLEARAAELVPSVVVAELGDLGDEPVERVQRLLERTKAQLVVVVWAFARRDLVLALSNHPRVRPVQGPLSLGNLRCQMLHLIVRDLVGDPASSPAGAATPTCPRCGERVA